MAALLFTGLLAGLAEAAPAAEPAVLPTLIRTKQVLELSAAEADREYPVRFTGIITCFDSAWTLFFITDEGGSIYFEPVDRRLDLKPGQRVEMWGRTAAGRASPYVRVAGVRKLGLAPLPPARRVSIDELSSAKEDAQWVEVAGVVHREHIEAGSMMLELAEGKNLVSVLVLMRPSDHVQQSLVDAQLVVRGHVAVQVNDQGQAAGFRLIVPSYNYLSVSNQAPIDPFSAPTRAVRSLLTYPYSSTPGHRVLVRGTLTLFWPGKLLVLHDQSGGLKVTSTQKAALRPGDQVEAAGFPGIGGYTPSLEDAVVRKIGSGPAPAPRPASPVGLLRGTNDNELVEIEADVESFSRTPENELMLVLREGTHLFRALLPTEATSEPWAGPAPGSRVRVRGICWLQADEYQKVVSFRLGLRGPGDVRVVRSPPWWTRRRVYWLVSGCALGLVGGASWVGLMRWRVRQQTAAIRQREARVESQFRDLFESANDIIFTHDLAGCLTSLNRAGELALGYSAAEARGLPWAKVLSEASWELMRNQIQSQAAQGTQTRYEVEARTKDGRPLILEVATRPDYDEGRLVGLRGIARDLTEQRQAQQALRHAEEKYRAIVERAVEGIFQVTPEGRLLTANAALARMLGYPSSQEVLTALSDVGSQSFVEPTDRQRFIQILETKGAVTGFEHQVYRRDGTKIWVRENAREVRDSAGKLLHYEGTMVDITQQKELESQVARAQRMQSLGVLAGGMAHELNNALAPIPMAVELLRSALPDENSDNLLEVVSDSSERAAGIVRQMLTFARGTPGRRRRLEFDHVVREIKHLTLDSFPKTIQVRTEVPPTVWPVTGDPTQLHQVLTNLCVNARDAMPEGGELALTVENVRLDESTAGIHPDAKPGPYVTISVTDQGAGMTQEVMDHLFEPFFTTKEVGKGTGLGLSVSLGIVRSHGGFMRVISEPRKGSKFTLYLPAEPEPPVTPTRPRPREAPVGHGELVLVVDDEPSVRMICQHTLELYGYKVLTASNGAEAMALYGAHRHEIKVVLTDMLMPMLPGPALVQALRNINPQVKIVAMSGRSDEYRPLVKVKGLDGALTKPFTANELLQALAEVLPVKS